jgi:hypothetical protein
VALAGILAAELPYPAMSPLPPIFTVKCDRDRWIMVAPCPGPWPPWPFERRELRAPERVRPRSPRSGATRARAGGVGALFLVGGSDIGGRDRTRLQRPGATA